MKYKIQVSGSADNTRGKSGGRTGKSKNSVGKKVYCGSPNETERMLAVSYQKGGGKEK